MVGNSPNLMAACAALSLVAACSNSTNAKVQERAAYWRALLAHDLPPGTKADVAKEWFRTRHLKASFLEAQHWVYANVESVPDGGLIPFPCSAWNIIIKIPVDANDRTTESDVSAVGTCL